MAKRYQIFISSTSKDLKKVREEVQDAIYSTRFISVGMECFGARNETVWETIMEQIECSDLLVLIIGGRYGSIDPKTGLSYTELEYNYARAIGIPVKVFIKKKEDMTIDEVRSNWDKGVKGKQLAAFTEKLEQNHHVVYWRKENEVKNLVTQSIGNEEPFAGAWIHFRNEDLWVFNQTTVEYGIVNIKVEGTPEECENGRAKLTYLGSSIVDSQKKPFKYQDRITALSGGKILSYKFISEAKLNILNEDQFKRNGNYLEYELETRNNQNKLSFISEVIIADYRLQKKQGAFGLHIPYYAKYMIVNINIADAQCIKNYNGKASLLDSPIPVKQDFNESNMTYTLIIENVPANSNMVFKWENDEV